MTFQSGPLEVPSGLVVATFVHALPVHTSHASSGLSPAVTSICCELATAFTVTTAEAWEKTSSLPM